MTIEEKAVEAYRDASVAGQELLESIFGKTLFKGDVMSRIHSFGDVLHENRIKLEQFEQQIQGLPKDEQVYRMLKLVVSAYNEGWKPNWRYKTENKWEVWIPYDSLFNAAGPVAVYSIHAPSFADASVGSRLVFKKREHAERAGKLFIDLWRYWFIEE